MQDLLPLLDKLLFVLHGLLIAFVLVGWAWRPARLPHLVLTGLIAFSWFVLGASHGIGYCLLTDWHQQVRLRMGCPQTGATYLQLLASELFGVTLGGTTSDRLAGLLFALMLGAAVVTWAREWWRWSGLSWLSTWGGPSGEDQSGSDQQGDKDSSQTGRPDAHEKRDVFTPERDSRPGASKTGDESAPRNRGSFRRRVPRQQGEKKRP
jgi:hypothetical protein